MTENDTTTISITTEQKAQLDEKKQHERESYKSVISRLLGTDPKGSPENPWNAEDDIADVLAELDGTLTYDDVKAACQAAIRDELPDGVFR